MRSATRCAYAAEHLGTEDGVLIVDETGFLSEGPVLGRGAETVLRHRGGPYFNKCSAEGCWWESEV